MKEEIIKLIYTLVGVIFGVLTGVVSTTIYLTKKINRAMKIDKNQIEKISSAFGQNLSQSKMNMIVGMMNENKFPLAKKTKKEVKRNK